jgi:hypothetical protein
MNLLTYTDSTANINHTFYFVVQPTNANNSINRITNGYQDNFNLHLYSNSAGFFPINRTDVERSYNIDISNSSTQFTNMRSSDYIVILLKVKYNSSLNYDYRLSFTGKSGSSLYDIDGIELLSCSAEYEVSPNMTLSTAEFDNGRLYEFGIIDEYVSDENFDKIKTSILDKYYL